MIRVLYLTWWEAALDNPLIDRQVFALVRELAARDDLEMHLGLADAFWKARLRGHDTTHLERLPERLPGVRLHRRQTPLCPRHVRPYAGPFLQRHLATGHAGWLRRLTATHHIDVVHCRSYPAARVAHAIRARHRLPWRIVFDTRGHYPEEGVLTGCYAADSPAYHGWKAIERTLFEDCDAVVNVSGPFTEAVRAIVPGARVHTIPTSVDLRAFADPPAGPRRGLVYLGGLSAGGWHSPAALAEMYHAVRDQLEHPVLQVICRHPPPELRDLVPAAELELCATRGLAETAAALAQAEWAALPYHAERSPARDLVARTMLASKTGEYLAAGLPLLVNHRIGGAGDLVRETGAGRVYEPGAPVRLPAVDPDTVRAAAARFDLRHHAERYHALYESVCR